MRQRGAGYTIIPPVHLVSNRLHNYSVLDLFLQTLALFFRPALSKSTTLQRPIHRYPQAHHQLPFLKQTPTAYPRLRLLYTRRPSRERDLSEKKTTTKSGFRNGKGRRPNKKTQPMSFLLRPIPNLSSTTHIKRRWLKRSQSSGKYESASWSRDHAKRHLSIHNLSLKRMDPYLCQNQR